MKPVAIEVKNPFFQSGEFQVMLIEKGGTTTRPENGSSITLDKTYWDVLATLWKPVAPKPKPKKANRPRLEFRRANQSALSNHNVHTPLSDAMSVDGSGPTGSHSDTHQSETGTLNISLLRKY